MSWCMNPMGSFEAIDKVINDQNSTVDDILKCEQLRGAFKRQHTTLLIFLSNHLIELTDIALGIKPVESPDLQAAALFCLSNDAPVFTNQISTNKLFLTKLSDFLKQDALQYPNLVAFYRIFKNCLEKSSGFMFINFPDKLTFIKNLIKMVDASPIYLLIKDISTNCYPTVNQFLENCKAPILFLESIDDNNARNQKVFDVLSSFASSAPSLSKMMVRDMTYIDKILTYALSDSNIVSESALHLMHNICALQDDDKLDIKPFQDVAEHVKEKVPDLCQLIRKEGIYTLAKSRAVKLICYLISSNVQSTPDCITELTKYLFDQIFLNPVQTFLHNDFLRLFLKISNKSDIIVSAEIQKVIPEKFEAFHDICANYWGQLFKVVETVNSSPTKPAEENEAWKTFIEQHYDEYLKILSTQYGGPMPSQKGENDSSYEYEYDYEEEDSSSSSDDDNSDEYEEEDDEYEYEEEDNDEEKDKKKGKPESK